MRAPSDWQVARFDTAWSPTSLTELLASSRSPTIANGVRDTCDDDRYGLILLDIPLGEYCRSGGDHISPAGRPHVHWRSAALLDLEKGCKSVRMSLLWIHPDIRFLPAAAGVLREFVPASDDNVPEIVTVREFLMMADEVRAQAGSARSRKV